MSQYLYSKNRKINKHRINNEIRGIKEVRLVGHPIHVNDIISLEKALELAKIDDLDLVEINKNSDPPICKIMDYSKFLFNEKKQKQNNKSLSMKEVKLSPNISDNDLEHKIKKIREFLIKGHMVKLFLMFRGREITHKNIGEAVFLKVLEKITDIGIFDLNFTLMGNKMTHLIRPKK